MTSKIGSFENFGEMIATSQPKISVHVIVYNQEHLIRETLDSILSQEYPDFEVIVGDDASTDGTQDIIREYEARYPNRVIGVYAEKNGGITANSNNALSRCTGEIIATIGGDDLFLPGKLARQVTVFRDPDVMLSYHPVEVFDGATGKTMYLMGASELESPRDGLGIISKYGVPAASVMFRRSACPQNGYDTRLPYASDWLLSIELGLAGKVIKVDEILARYRKHSGNIGNSISRYEKDFIETLRIVEEKYGDRPGIREACAHGKARYLFGYAFRVAQVNLEQARNAAIEARQLDPSNWRYQIGALLFSVPTLARLAGRFRKFLRRFAS